MPEHEQANRHMCMSVYTHTHTHIPAVIFHRGPGTPCFPRIEVADRGGKDKEEDNREGEGKEDRESRSECGGSEGE